LRESLLRFSELRTVLVGNPKEALDELYARYVGRNFVNKEYREEAMARSIKKQLAIFNLDKQYVKHTFEKDLRKVALPLVNKNMENIKVMKPLAFDQKDPSALIEHAELWHNKIQWFLQRDVLKRENVLLPIEKPEGEISGDLLAAYNIVAKDLENLGVEMVNFDNATRIVEFAREGATTGVFH